MSFKSVLASALLPLLVATGCQSVSEKADSSGAFRLIEPSESGITFNNQIQDVPDANILLYEGFYDGGGVSIGDINNDGLQDIYFAGNQISDQLYLNKGSLQFEEISKSAGILDKGGWSSGVTMADVNQDGLLDIYVCKTLYDEDPELRRNELYINNGDLTFTESAGAYLLDDFWRAKDASFVDYDNDGDLDLFLVNQPPNPGFLSSLSGEDWLDTLYSCRLYQNNDLKFKDVSNEAGVLNRGYGLSVSASDLNNDGWIDFYVSNDYDSPDFLYMNNGDGTFTNKINDYLAHISYFSMGSDAADINNDGLIDLLILDMVAEDNYRLKANMGGMEPEAFWRIVDAGGHRQYMFNTLQLNRGAQPNGHLYFSEVGQLGGVSSTDWSWSPLVADFDNDGNKDIFITNGLKKDLRNTDAIATTEQYLRRTIDDFVRKNPNAGDVNIWSIIDMDSILSFIPSQKINNYVFKNNGNLTFEKKIEEWGLDQQTFSSGAAYGDLDNDGDLDLVVNNTDEVAFLYENRLNSANFLRVQLLKNNMATSFPGAKVEITHDDKKQLYEIASTRGFYSSSEALAHFGLGDASQVDKLKVYWPGGKVSTLENIEVNQLVTVDIKDATTKVENKQAAEVMFTNSTEQRQMNFEHRENLYDDYQKEVLLPHKMSTLGAGASVADVNMDGLEDIFIGNARGSSGSLFIQQAGGDFVESNKSTWFKDQDYEDMGATFFDADNDGDQDLYVVSGGNEKEPGHESYLDRIYINEQGNFTRFHDIALPSASGSRVVAADYDQDGDVDLFVGGRQIPGSYPTPAESSIIQNQLVETGKLSFAKLSASDAPDLTTLGMVTDAVWTDFDQDQDLDLFVVGEWMTPTLLENQDGTFVNASSRLGLDEQSGWWFSIEQTDLDHDGDMDYVLGNLGLNYKYQASMDEPFSINYGDFDNNGSNDIVLSYYNFGTQYPLRGRSCSSQQVPSIKNKFTNYSEFASATLTEVYGQELLNSSLQYEATIFQSIVLENLNGTSFKIHPLPMEAQFSTVNDIIIHDFNQDGKEDLIIAGNMYGSEIETPRADAGLGLLLLGQGNFEFQPIPAWESGVFLPFDVRDLQLLKLGDRTAFIIVCNNDQAILLEYLK